MGIHRSYGGHRQQRPRSIDEALIVCDRMAASWIRWLEVLRTAAEQENRSRITLDDLSPAVRRRLLTVSTDFRRLRKEIAVGS